jgi:hypothetical protein
MKAEFRTMWRTAGLSLLAAILTAQANAQGGNTQGGNAQGGNPQGQLLVAPPCLAIGPIVRPGAAACTLSTHRDWLANITHWRANAVSASATMGPATICLNFNGPSTALCSPK